MAGEHGRHGKARTELSTETPRGAAEHGTTATTARPGPMPVVPWPGVRRDASRSLEVVSTAAVDAGATRTWAYLDNAEELAERGLSPVGTLLCVHGNPTWSYLWRGLVAAGAGFRPGPWRVVAVDQLNMGWSERTGTFRSLPDRVRDLGDFTRALGLDKAPGQHGVVTVAHDWGGLVSQGWGADHPGIHAGRVLTNTALFQPQGAEVPGALRLALHPAVHGLGTRTTTAFLDVTLSLHRGEWDPEVRRTYRAPYADAERRAGIGDFVADIPLDPQRPAHAEMARISRAVEADGKPALILWGPHDPVFQQRYFDDLLARMPQATVHRYEKAGHLVAEDEDIAQPIQAWLAETFAGSTPVLEAHRQERTRREQDERIAAGYRPMVAELEARREDDSPAVVDMGPARIGGSHGRAPVRRSLTWRELFEEVEATAALLRRAGVRRGTRVSLMVPPGSRLTVLIYACLGIGAVIVVADTGLGLKGLTRALRGASPEFLVGIPQALLAGRAAGWPGRRILAGRARPGMVGALGLVAWTDGRDGALTTASGSAPGAVLTTETDSAATPWNRVRPEDPAAILYTSGSTGPAKGVAYTHRQLAAMRDAIQRTYQLEPGSGLVAGFAPFALLGPALGATSVTPDMDVTQPKSLTAGALAQAAQAIDATVVFASPAALMNVVATADELTPPQRLALGRVRLMLSAGAPLTTPLLRRVARLVPGASVHTPYGMTEALPVADIDLTQILQAEEDSARGVTGAGNGVCVGVPIYGVELALALLDRDGHPASEPSHAEGRTGEILVSARHMKDHYDRLWWTERTSVSIPGWHRTGDIGHFDAAGRLWVEGRLAHLIHTTDGVLSPVAIESAAETVPGVRRAAAVGVGPEGAQVPVVVIEPSGRGADAASPQTDAVAADAVAARDEDSEETAGIFVPDPSVRPGPAGTDMVQRVRRAVAEATGVVPVAVLQVAEHPTDIRHNSKIDRPRLAAWAQQTLSGGKVKKP